MRWTDWPGSNCCTHYMTPQCSSADPPPHQKGRLRLSRYYPVATTISHGGCSQDYHGDNPEVKGSVPGAGPPTLWQAPRGATLLQLWRLSVVYLMSSFSEQSIKLYTNCIQTLVYLFYKGPFPMSHKLVYGKEYT